MECNDRNCPMHGSLKVRGMVVTGKVVSTRMRKSVVVERDLFKPVSKYKRRAKTKSKLHAHLPECIKVNLGDEVEIGQTRKLSKTKGWVVLRVIKGKEVKGEPVSGGLTPEKMEETAEKEKGKKPTTKGEKKKGERK